jgi:hypothetical protein
MRPVWGDAQVLFSVRSSGRWFAALAAAVLVAAGCGSGGDGGPAAVSTTTTTTTGAEAPAAVSARDLVGHWDSAEYGDLYLRAEGDEVKDEVKMVYTANDGRVLGSFDGKMIVGWWNQVFNGRPAGGGEAEFTVVRSGGRLSLDTRWRYGTRGEWHEDWDLVYVDDAIPSDVAAKFADPSRFIAHP